MDDSGNSRDSAKQELNSSMGEADKVFLAETGAFGFVNDLTGIGLDQVAALNLMKRQDTKYILPFSSLPVIFAAIAGRYLVQEISGKRVAVYETLYYDSPGLKFYHDHINGKLNHCKVRRRSYLDSDLHFLEVKSKTSKGDSIKTRIRVYSGPETFSQEEADLIQLYAKTDFNLLTPRLLNRFHRITLVDREMTERVTVDFDLTFAKYGNGRSYTQDNLAIIEIKKDKTASSFLQEVLSDKRIKKSGISKYCLGMALTEQAEKLNPLKLKIRQIQKIIANEYVA